MLIREPVQHLLIPGRQIRGAVVSESEADLLLLREPGAAHRDDLVALCLNDADVADAGSLGALDSAVAGEDAVLLVDNDGASGAVALQGLFD